MEDDKIKQLFADFCPQLGSADEFIGQLERNLEAVEKVKQQYADLKKKTRRSVVLASAVGFASGVLASRLYSLAGNWFPEYGISLQLAGIDIQSNIVPYFGWLLTAVVAVLTAVNTYHINMGLYMRRSL